MKELGQRMHCDPSFVTSIADMMEKRGLAVRESDPADRRVKRLVLTAGLDMRRQVEQAMLERSPWRQALPPRSAHPDLPDPHDRAAAERHRPCQLPGRGGNQLPGSCCHSSGRSEIHTDLVPGRLLRPDTRR